MALVEEIYQLTGSFPLSERFNLVDQMRRAVVSIPSNLAEGYVRDSTKTYLYHVDVAAGSLAELQTQVELSRRLGYITRENQIGLQKKLESLLKQLFALRNALSKKL